MEKRVEGLDIGEWIEKELSNLSGSEIETLASEELENLKDFVSPEMYSFLAPHSAVQQDSTSSLSTASATSSLSAAEATHSFSESKKLNVTDDRFGTAISEKELLTAIENRVPANTKKSTNWGFNIWKDWCKCRGVYESIESMPDSDINKLMARFVQEVKRKDGKDYPPSSLNNIVAAIQRHLRENGRPEVNFYDKHSAAFDLLRKSLDARMKALTRIGVGTVKRQAQPVTPEMENTLWEKGIFSHETSKGLLNVVFWYTCKLFGLRAADEHKRLEVSQFVVGDDETGHFLRFVGKSCKNWQGGLNRRKVEAKDLKIYADPSLGSRCAVSCFEFYLSLIPSSGQLYHKAIGDHPPRFSSQIIGIHRLENIVKDFCTEAGFRGFFTNHSGKVTCATQLFKHNVDEQLIMRQTGHRSTDAVRMYKRPSAEHQPQVSRILQPPAPKQAALAVSNIESPAEDNVVRPSTTTSTSTKSLTFTAEGNSIQNIHITF